MKLKRNALLELNFALLEKIKSRDYKDDPETLQYPSLCLTDERISTIFTGITDVSNNRGSTVLNLYRH